MNLNELNSTNLKIVVGCLMGLGLIVYFCTSAFFGHPIPEIAFGEALAFAAAFSGIAYAQFAKKRDTYVAPSPDSTRSGDVPTDAPAPSAPAAAVTAPVEPDLPEEGVEAGDEGDGGATEAAAAEEFGPPEPLAINQPRNGKAPVVPRVSPHFVLGEFCVSASRPDLVRPVPANLVMNVGRLATSILEPIRVALGVPVIILSGYRPPALNKAIGGSPTSQHMQAAAADWTVRSRPARTVMADLMAGKLGGIPKCGQCIFYPEQNFIHIALPSEGHPHPTFQVHSPKRGLRYHTVTTPAEMLRLTR